ncbi:PQQ-binding-like beta-propeller repeat protein [Anaerosporobacter faecicola]|uniref:hypothetical protein n=1 Tax=Anaerosporobacter faecicola TaxID=2718714 RepID=UPI00143B8EC5|nr:hypothetical protein [Anaerosporobacter faecicola]
MKRIVTLFLCLCLVFGYSVQTVHAEEDTQTEIKFKKLKKPPMKYTLTKGTKTKKVSPLTLTLKSKKANKITDDEEWFSKNDLELPVFVIPGEFNNYSSNLPYYIDWYCGDLYITNAFEDASYIYCVYGGNYAEGYKLYIYSKKNGEIVYKLDFSNYRYSSKYVKEDYDYVQQEIKWAKIVGNVLYVSNSHDTYAKSSYNMNAYITAIDLSTYKILWRSSPLVANCTNFEIIGNVIICGYGFTDEKDYLYQLNRTNGKVISKIALKTAPEYIIKKGSKLYVRTYNTDYVFKIGK